jgi:hypothetical protein
MSRGRWKFTKREVKRAVKAVEDAGLTVASVEFTDHKLTVHVANPSHVESPSTAWDDAIAELESTS